jgi:hypothetical protein
VIQYCSYEYCSYKSIVYLETTTEILVCTRHAAEATAKVRFAHATPGRATGTFPRARRAHAHRWNKCGRCRRLRLLMRSCPAPLGCMWGRRCRSWPRTQYLLEQAISLVTPDNSPGYLTALHHIESQNACSQER